MKNETETSTLNDLPSTQKFGEVMEGGFFMVPNLLILHQANLGLSNTELVILLNLMTHWFTESSSVFPSTDKIAKRMNISRRSVQLGLKKLLKNGFIEEVKTSDRYHRGEKNAIVSAGARHFSLLPLKEKLKPLAKYSYRKAKPNQNETHS